MNGKKIYIYVWIGLAVVYFFTRLYHLLILPIFTDEAIYIYWAKHIGTTYSDWFISLGDGKPPVLIWIIAVLLKIFPSGMYLEAGRFASVIFGFISLIGIYKLALLLFDSRKTAVLSGLLYIFTPILLFYDRMALFDSMLTAMSLWSVYFMVKTARSLSIKDAVWWGAFLGMAMLSKPTALIFVVLTPVCFLILEWTQLKKNWKQLVKLVILSVLISQILSNLQRVSSVYFMMARKNSQFQVPLTEFLSDPFRYFFNNFRTLVNWMGEYYSWPVFIAGIAGEIWLLIKKFKTGLILAVLWLVTVLGFSFLGREIFPRYIVFVTPYMLLPLSYLITGPGEDKTDPPSPDFGRIRRASKSDMFTGIKIIFVLLILIPVFRFDWLILTNPPEAPLPETDYNQYVAHHPSGYGLAAVYQVIDRDLKAQRKVTLVTQGTFGLYPYAFMLRYWDNSRVDIKPEWPIKLESLESLKVKSNKVYVVYKEFRSVPDDFPYKIVTVGEKPGGDFPVIVVEIN